MALGHYTHTGSEGIWWSGKGNDLPATITRNPQPFKFEVNQTVKIIRPGLHHGLVGTVTSRREGSPHKYNVHIPIGDALTPIYPFAENELEAVSILPMVIPQSKRPDRFMCEWGVCELSRHPDIPKRWAARHVRSGAVITLEAQSQSTRQEIAHQKFLAFMETLNRDIPLTPNTPAEWHAHIAARLARWEQRKVAA